MACRGCYWSPTLRSCMFKKYSITSPTSPELTTRKRWIIVTKDPSVLLHVKRKRGQINGQLKSIESVKDGKCNRAIDESIHITLNFSALVDDLCSIEHSDEWISAWYDWSNSDESDGSRDPGVRQLSVLLWWDLSQQWHTKRKIRWHKTLMRGLECEVFTWGTLTVNCWMNFESYNYDLW